MIYYVIKLLNNCKIFLNIKNKIFIVTINQINNFKKWPNLRNSKNNNWNDLSSEIKIIIITSENMYSSQFAYNFFLLPTK